MRSAPDITFCGISPKNRSNRKAYTLDENSKERERKYIREKIVPRKKYKKILGILGTVLGSAIVFGAASGAMFYLMQETLNRNDAKESQVETIVIARDDVSLSPESTEEEETSKTAQETASMETESNAASLPAETEGSGGEESTGQSGSAESTAETKKETASSDHPEASSPESTSAEEESASAESTEAPEKETGESKATLPSEEEESLQPPEIRNSAALITVHETGATDWFSAAIREKRELYGVIIAENSESVLILTKAVGLDAPGASIEVDIDGIRVPAEFQKGDSISGLAVLRAAKRELIGHYELLPLGNSLTISSADPVWFSGFTPETGTGVNSGQVTYIEGHRAVVDGYVQKISTSMLHYPGEQGVLLNGKGEMIGIVSDESCTEGPVMTAWGISPLKYLLEDMCSGSDTAYIGIRCMDVTQEEGVALGIPSGLYIQEVAADSPAYAAGLLPGDRVVRLDAGSVSTNHVLLVWMDKLEAGREIVVEIARRGPDGYEPLEILLTPEGRR